MNRCFITITAEAMMIEEVLKFMLKFVFARVSQAYNRRQKIMKLLKILVEVRFSIIKVVTRMQYKKHCIRVVSRVAEQLKTWVIRKCWENKKNGRKYGLVLSLPSKNKTSALVVKKYSKTDFKFLLYFPILLNFSTLFHKFCPLLQT